MLAREIRLQIPLDFRLQGAHYGYMADVVERVCKQCSGPLSWAGTGRVPVYCSKRCKQAAYRGTAPTSLDVVVKVAPIVDPIPPKVTLPKVLTVSEVRKRFPPATVKEAPLHGPETTCNCGRCRVLRGGWAT